MCQYNYDTDLIEKALQEVRSLRKKIGDIHFQMDNICHQLEYEQHPIAKRFRDKMKDETLWQI